ncbi:hypothetical protein LCGC14_3087840 [marine sediment metagenome]|uniref:Uncharacterized protein n=1 Tax=marine sediment metagenome TaxID=412755 RepID=A0A0F8X017_9ZZZZ
MNHQTYAIGAARISSNPTGIVLLATNREIMMFNVLPDDSYFHSQFGSDSEKCPGWFAVIIGLSMVLFYGAIGLILVSIIFQGGK